MEERKRILEMLQQGKIDVEQATKLLDALQVSQQADVKTGAEQVEVGQPKAQEKVWEKFGEELSQRIQSGLASAGIDQNLAETIQARITAAMSGMKSALGNVGMPSSSSEAHREEKPMRYLLTCERLNSMEDGSSYSNYTGTEIAADVPEDLLRQKIGDYENYGTTYGPATLLRILMGRCSQNYGPWVETEPAAEERPAGQHQPVRGNYVGVTFSRRYLESMEDGTIFKNYGGVEVSSDVSEELLMQKIARFENYGAIQCPSHLMGFFEKNAKNYGALEEIEPTSGSERHIFNHSDLKLTRHYLMNLKDGSTLDNLGDVTIADDVTEELILQKIGNYINHGVTTGPAHLLGVLQSRCSENYGNFTEKE